MSDTVKQVILGIFLVVLVIGIIPWVFVLTGNYFDWVSTFYLNGGVKYARIS